MTSLYFPPADAAAHYAEVRADPPKTVADLGLMAGFPAPPAQRVTWENWIRPPFNRWGFRNLAALRPSLRVRRGDGPVAALKGSPRDLAGFAFDSIAGRAVTLSEHLLASYTDAFLVMQDDRVLHESYHNGQRPDDRHIMFSCTKSLIGLVAEHLLLQGTLREDDPVARHVPELKDSAFGDASVRHLLDMAVGIDYVEQYDDPDAGSSHYGYAAGFMPAPEGLARYASLYEYLPSLKKKGVHGPLFHYVTAVTEVLGWVLERASGRAAEAWVEELLWSRLGMEQDGAFLADPWGRAVVGGGFSGTLRDMARIGRLVLGEGRVDGTEILPAAVIRSIARGSDPAYFAAVPEFSDWAPGASYRSQWYMWNDGAPELMACGIHGQYIYVDAASRLVVVKQSSLPAAEPAIGADTVRLLRALARHLR